LSLIIDQDNVAAVEVRSSRVVITTCGVLTSFTRTKHLVSTFRALMFRKGCDLGIACRVDGARVVSLDRLVGR